MAYSAIPIVGGGAEGDPRRILNTWTVGEGHDFEVGNVVYYIGGTTGFAKAQANDLDSTQTVGVVEAVGVNSIRVVYQGEIDFTNSVTNVLDDLAPGLTPGLVYYVSITNAGNLTSVRPAGGASYIHGLLVATTPTNGLVINALPQSGSSASLFTPVGSIIPWGGGKDTVPETWKFCDGEAVLKTGENTADGEEYAELYQVIGDKYKISASVTEVTNGNLSLVLNFEAENHEDGSVYTLHGLGDAYSNDSNLDYAISWGDKSVVAVLDGTDVDEVTFTYKQAYDGSSPANFSTLSPNQTVFIKSLASGEVAGATSDRFFIPDLRGQSVFGAGNSVGFTEFYRGNVGGSDTHLITTDEIPDHDNVVYTAVGDTGSGRQAIVAAVANVAPADTVSLNASFTADNEPMSLMPPHTVANWIIRHRRFQGPGIEIGPRGCALYLDRVEEDGNCKDYILGYTGPGTCSDEEYTITVCDGLQGTNGTQGPAGTQGADGTQGPEGTQGADGTDGDDGAQGPAGANCVCQQYGNNGGVQGLSDTIYFEPESDYKDGIVGNPNATYLDAKFSTDPLYPTDFGYFTQTLRSTGTLPSTKVPFYYRDPSNIVNEDSVAYARTLNLPTNPNQKLSRPTVTNLSIINDSASTFFRPLDIVLKPGIYTLNDPFYNYIDRDLYIRAAGGSVVTQNVSAVTVLPNFTTLGATSQDSFSLRIQMATGQPAIAATGCGLRILPPLSLRAGATGAFGLTAGIDGATSGTAGFFNLLVGGYEVVGVSGSNITVNYRNEGGLTFTGYLNQTYNQFLRTVDIYRVTVHTTSNGGALFSGRGTRTYLGEWELLNNADSDGIAFINHAVGQNLNDASMEFYITGGSFENSIAVQTDGGAVSARNCMFINYPVAAHAYSGGTIDLNTCTISDSYYGVAADTNANVEIAASIVTRSSVPVIMEGAGSLKITNDLQNIGRSHIKGNKAAVSVINSKADIGSLTVYGSGVFSDSSTVKIRPFTEIYADIPLKVGPGAASQGGFDTIDGGNSFAIASVNSFITTPDLSGATSAIDPVSRTQRRKFAGVGGIEAVTSKIVLTAEELNFILVSDTLEPEETFKKQPVTKE